MTPQTLSLQVWRRAAVRPPVQVVRRASMVLELLVLELVIARSLPHLTPLLVLVLVLLRVAVVVLMLLQMWTAVRAVKPIVEAVSLC